MEFVCKRCGRKFVDKNYKRKRVYCSLGCMWMDNPPPVQNRDNRKKKYWQSKKWLIENYDSKTISVTALSKSIKCHRRIVSGWLRYFGIRIKKRIEIQSGKNNPFYGKKHSKNTKEKMSGYRSSVSGDRNPNWKGGCGNIYYGENWSKQRRLVRLRDKNICQDCGIKDNSGCKNMDVHHIKRFLSFNNYKEANRLENLVCLCSVCHTRREKS